MNRRLSPTTAQPGRTRGRSREQDRFVLLPRPRSWAACPVRYRPRARSGSRCAGGLDQVCRELLLVFEQGLEHMQGRELLMAAAQGKCLRRLNQRLETITVFLDLHGSSPGVTMAGG